MKGLFSFAIGAILIFVGSSQGANPKVVCTTPGALMPDPNDCHLYYVCSQDLVPAHAPCAPGYYFDEPTLTCRPPPVTCAVSVTSTTAAPTTTTYNAFACKHPSQIVPYPYDCKTFFICDENLYPAYHYQCDPGSFYAPEYANCNFQESVSCFDGIRPSPIPTAIPALITAPPEVEAACSSPDAYPGLLVPNPTECSAWWKCNENLIPEYFVCASSLLFDRVKLLCVDINVAICF